MNVGDKVTVKRIYSSGPGGGTEGTVIVLRPELSNSSNPSLGPYVAVFFRGWRGGHNARDILIGEDSYSGWNMPEKYLTLVSGIEVATSDAFDDIFRQMRA